MIATPDVPALLYGLVVARWRIPRALRRRLLGTLLRSSCARATTLRWQLALAGTIDVDATLRQLLTPEFVVHLINDLRVVGHFSQAETSSIQEAILAAVTTDGDWSPPKDV